MECCEKWNVVKSVLYRESSPMVLLPGEDGSGLGPCCLSKGCCVLTNTGVFCSAAVGVLGFYQKFLFLIRLLSILKASDLLMAQGGKPEQSLALHRGGSCFCPEVQGATVDSLALLG